MLLVYVALALALLALAMGSLALHRTNKRSEGFSGPAPALVDLKELATLHPDLKQAYRGAVVDKIAPAAIRIVNAAWTDLDERTRKRVLSMVSKAAADAADELNRNLSAKVMSRAIRAYDFDKAIAAAVAATTKPMQ